MHGGAVIRAAEAGAALVFFWSLLPSAASSRLDNHACSKVWST